MMKNLFLRLFGASVSSRLGQWLLWQIVTPHRHLHDRDGSLYMGRWRVVDEDTIVGRILEFLTGYASVRLHRIMREDHDRDLHNHPFHYRTFIVDGYYQEEYQRGVTVHWWNVYERCFGRGESTTGSPDKFHRITEVSQGGVLTLFFMGRNTGIWGFSVNGTFQESTRYLLRKGYTRTHVEEAQTR